MYKALADGGFSSGSNYAALEAAHIEGYVALYGQYHKQREGFTGSRRLMMPLRMYTSAGKAKSLITEVLEQKKVTSITIIEANPAIVRPVPSKKNAVARVLANK